MFFAGLAEVHGGFGPDERDGLVIITAASDEGMVDIHDRKPLVLAPKHAREWVDPETSPERAAEIAVVHCRPTEDFPLVQGGQGCGQCAESGASFG